MTGVLVWVVTLPALGWALLRLSGTGDGYPAVQLLAFTPYLLPVAVLGTVLAGLSRRWAALALALLATVALAGTVLPRAVGGPDADAGGLHLRVLTANMRVGSSDPNWLVSLVRTHRVDLLALQEFTPQARDRLRAAGLTELLPYQVAYPLDEPGGSALYSRYPLTDGGYRTMPLDFGQAFALLHAPDGTVIRVESAHPCAPASREWLPGWRIAQALEPRADPHAGPQILVGDFNATLDHPALRELLASGYTDVAAKLGDGLTPTWPFDGRWVPGITIDHVLVAGLRAYAYTTYPDPGSDHHAVYAEIGR